MLELRPDDKSAPLTALTRLDEVVCDDVRFLHAEMMDNDHLWIAIDRHDGSRTDLNITVRRDRVVAGKGRKTVTSIHMRGEQVEHPPKSAAILPEPAPIRQPHSVDVWPLVWADVRKANRNAPSEAADKLLEDMQARSAQGYAKYGTTLHSHNGRNPLVDAYQEALDQVVYLRQAAHETSAEPDEDLAVLINIAYGLALQGALTLAMCVHGIAAVVWTIDANHLLADHVNIHLPDGLKACALLRRHDNTLHAECVRFANGKVVDRGVVHEVAAVDVSARDGTPPELVAQLASMLAGIK